MSTDLEPDGPAVDDALQYRSVHTGAVLGLLLGVVSSVVWFTASTSFESTLMLAPIPVFALVVSLSAWRAINASPHHYTGLPLARGGALLAVLFLFTGLGYSGYVYSTEVPDGYVRTSFIEMKPSEADKVDRKYIPDDIESYLLNGEKVFIKGFIRPDSFVANEHIKEFLLVRDSQECCFGDLSKVRFFDQIQVQLAPGLTTSFSRGLYRLGGTLKLGPGDPELGTPITYHLIADYHRAPGESP